jgi:integrase/recombinase XerD
MNAATLPALIQRFFTDRLCVQMEASRHTVAGYRDTFRLLLRFASVRHGKPPVKLTVEDIDADLVADFLVHGETARGNSARSRNTRLAAIRSFFRYVAMTDPTRLLHCQRVLAMPNKRYVKRAVTFLDAEEIAALLAAPDRTTWAGRQRSCAAPARDPDGPAGIRAGEPAVRRRGAGQRRAYPLHGQGPEGALHAAPSRHG